MVLPVKGCFELIRWVHITSTLCGQQPSRFDIDNMLQIQQHKKNGP